MQIRLANLEDIHSVLELQKKYQIDSIAEVDKKDGFVTTSFSYEQLTKLINQEQGLIVAIIDNKIAAYVMVASWQYWSVWPIFAFMINDLRNLHYLGQELNTTNSYQYGPICIDSQYRGLGVLESIFEFAREHMSKRYPILVTFINKINQRSYKAHTQKLNLKVIQEFSFNNNHFYELVYDTSVNFKNLHTTR
jgi:hypothetical protein